MAGDVGTRADNPTLDAEARLWAQGLRCVAGLDEAGRGALAGPVVAAAVVVPPDAGVAGVWSQVRDSKLLTPPRRAALAAEVTAAAWAWGVGVVTAAVIDRDGIAAATRQAMQEAVAALGERPEHLLIDWVRLPSLNIPQTCVAKADRHMVSVAAASILAKVTRDRLMVALDAAHPGYGFAGHKGYGTPAHLAALAQHGPCCEHRRSFAPVAHRATLLDASTESGSQP